MTEAENGKLEESQKTEVVAKAKRRQHSAEYKLRILQELDACSGKGEIGAVLRREGLYSSLVSKWREQREKGSLNGLELIIEVQKKVARLMGETPPPSNEEN
jgi:transposase-like protein